MVIVPLGPDTAATLLIAAGSNPDRLRTEAAFSAAVILSDIGSNELV